MVILHQFAASHFNEKARWALDFKKVAHRRQSYLPGPHMPVIRKMSGAHSSTPLLEHDGKFVQGSARIIDWLESNYPEPALYPPDNQARAQALAWQKRLDTVVGPATRSLVFAILLQEPVYVCATFAAGKPFIKRMAYLAVFPLTRPLIAKANGVNAQNLVRAKAIAERALDEIAAAVAKTGYLAGEGFSVADLAAASLLAPLTNVQHPDMKRIEPMPVSVQGFIAQWQAHPAIRWVQEIYARHRPVRVSGGTASATE